MIWGTRYSSYLLLSMKASLITVISYRRREYSIQKTLASSRWRRSIVSIAFCNVANTRNIILSCEYMSVEDVIISTKWALRFLLQPFWEAIFVIELTDFDAACHFDNSFFIGIILFLNHICIISQAFLLFYYFPEANYALLFHYFLFLH